jgi:hypothetical protein
MTVYPRYTSELNGDYLRGTLDHDAIVGQLRGFTTSGTFTTPFPYILSKTVVGGVTYYQAANAYQIVYGGVSSAGSTAGTSPSAVMNAAIAGGGFFLQPGTYPLDAGLSLPDDNTTKIVMLGIPSESIISCAAASDFTMMNWGGTVNHAGLFMDGLTWDGSSQTASGNHGLFFYNPNNLTIQNCDFLDIYGFGLFLSPDTGADGKPKAGLSSSNLRILNNRFKGCGWGENNDMFGGGWFSDSWIVGNRFEDNYGTSIDHVGPAHCYYLHNTFLSPHDPNTGTAIFSSDGGMNHCEVAHNILKSLGSRSAIYFAENFAATSNFGACEYNDIHHNLIDGCATGITVQSATDGYGPLCNKINNNIIKNAANAMYVLDGKQCEVKDNLIIDWNKDNSGDTIPSTAIVIDSTAYGSIDDVVAGNVLVMNQARTVYGVFLYGASQPVTDIRLYDNDLAAATNPLNTSGTVTYERIEGNTGNVTENGGLTSAGTSSITVTHGLANGTSKITPNDIQVTPIGSAVVAKVDSVGDTTFLITWTEGGSIAFYWNAKYHA